MNKLIIIKYGELSTKKDNISFFLKTLKNNVVRTLGDVEYKIKYDFGRMFIETDDIDLVFEKLKSVFGIHEIIIGFKFDSNDKDDICKSVLDVLLDKMNFSTFKVQTKRADKTYSISSMDLSRYVGSFLLKNIPDISVSVNNPDILVNIEIRSDYVYIYYDRYRGLGGYPVGTQGKSLLMLSGGIDSPVAGYLAIKRGISLDCIYFDSPPHTSEDALNKVLMLSDSLSKYDPNIGVYIVNFTKVQEEILKKIPHEYLITIMRRMMYRISEKLALRKKFHTIINGESIGQVASQTLTSMKCINSVISLPVIRPVACFDKLEIIEISKKIGTYDTSILPFDDCCTIFVPKHPVINPNIRTCLEYEQLIDVDTLVLEVVNSAVYKKIEKNTFDDLL